MSSSKPIYFSFREKFFLGITKKFHMTKQIRAGYKIYEFCKSIRYKSTSKFPNVKYQIITMLSHFFSLQKVLQKMLPCRIQNKFFNLIRSKN